MACDGSTILVEKTNFQALNNVAQAFLKLQHILIREMNFDCGKQQHVAFCFYDSIGHKIGLNTKLEV